MSETNKDAIAKTKKQNKDRGIKGKEARLRVRKTKVGNKAMNFLGEKQVSQKKSEKLLDREEKIGNKIREIRNKKNNNKGNSPQNYGTMKTPTNMGHKTPVNDGHKTMANKNMAPNFYVMDPGSPAKKMDTPGPFSYKAQTTMNKLGMVDSGMNDGHSTPLDDAGHGGKTGHKHEDSKPFRYESDVKRGIVGMPTPPGGTKVFTGTKLSGTVKKVGEEASGVRAYDIGSSDNPRFVTGNIVKNVPYKTGDPKGSGKQINIVKGSMTRFETDKEVKDRKKKKLTIT